ncbi:hypothetical protein [Phytohabitans rumicis]|uniref:FXSXX-COOH protein n=1 Tax=Phytohabitans rumicis TaxID=1076125 RepID=A0A6V8KZ21_9ACTN|nr:hypothetical protein [Phytohabitans rumicis]GFJ87559.1 hypothetical protein Prum_012010 [Phytohabitans rumicis]
MTEPSTPNAPMSCTPSVEPDRKVPSTLTIKFDTDAPVLTPGASRALLGLLLSSDRRDLVKDS